MQYLAVRQTRSHRRLLMPAICACLVGYFCFHTLAGQYGLLKLPVYQERKAELLDVAEELALDIRYYENRVTLLGQSRVDPDLAEELIRRDLGYARRDEFIVPVP